MVSANIVCSRQPQSVKGMCFGVSQAMGEGEVRCSDFFEYGSGNARRYCIQVITRAHRTERSHRSYNRCGDLCTRGGPSTQIGLSAYYTGTIHFIVNFLHFNISLGSIYSRILYLIVLFFAPKLLWIYIGSHT